MMNNGQHSVADSGMATPESITAAMEAINTLAVWLEETGLDKSAIAHFKYNALAKKFPGFADIIEDAKKLIATTKPLSEVGMTVSEVGQRLSDDLGRKIKPAQVNEALVELGFQVRPDNGKRIWQLTESGKEYGFSRLATSLTNDWSGPQVTWGEAVIPVLIDYFESTPNADSSEQASPPSPDSTVLTKDGASNNSPPPASFSERSLESEPESKSWMLTERLKSSKKKVTASQRLHIEMEAVEAYKQRHRKPPAKEQVKGKYHDVYPTADLDLLDAAIERVLKRYAKST